MEHFSEKDERVIPHEMYEVSGAEPITEHSFSRYIKDKEQDAEIRKHAPHPFSYLLDLQESIVGAPSHKRAALVAEALKNRDINVQKAALKVLDRVPENDHEGLYDAIIRAVEHGLSSDDPESRATAADLIIYAPANARASLVAKGLEANDAGTKRASAEMIRYIHGEDAGGIVTKGLDSTDVETQKIAAGMIGNAPREFRVALIAEGIGKHDAAVRKAAAGMLCYLQPEEKAAAEKLIENKIGSELSSGSAEDHIAALGLVRFAGEDSRTAFIEAGLSDEDARVQTAAAHAITYAPFRDREKLRHILRNIIDIKLSGDDPSTRSEAVRMVAGLKEEDRVEILTLALGKTDISVQKAAEEMLPYVPMRREQEPLREMIARNAEKGMDSSDENTRKIAVSMIPNAPENMKPELLELVGKKGLSNILVRNPLYDRTDPGDDHFARRAFSKTGSGTTLIGGDLKNKTIVRHIKPEAFLNWQALYENSTLWRENGFGYVPIEPIQSYRLTDAGLVDAYSGVLDLSLASWKNITSKWRSELEESRDKIIETVNKARMEHGHTHDHNFCLRFFRDEHGNADLSRMPRIYLIDFDQAISS